MQKFFTDTLVSRFIKYMLSVVDIPKLDIINTDYYLYNGLTYLYKNNIIKCTQSGYFDKRDGAYPGEETFPLSSFYPSDDQGNGGGTVSCTYEVIDTLGKDPNTIYPQYRYSSNTGYYDSETHKHLGQYLRYLRDVKNINLMHYYNCYNNASVSGITLKTPTDGNSKSYVNYSSTSKKILAVPIKFNRTYTIAIESSSPVLVRSVIWNEGHVSVKDKKDTTLYYSDHPTLEASYRVYSSIKFGAPQTYRVNLTEDVVCKCPDENHTGLEINHVDLYSQQDYLYMLIQVDETNTSSLVVLEGDYTNLKTVSCTPHIISSNENFGVKKPTLYHNLSLLSMNTGISYPFSNRLIEYLLNNIIYHAEELPGNIEAIQNVFYSITKQYNQEKDTNIDYWKDKSQGVWDDSIQRDISKLVDKWSHDVYMVDMDNNVNVDFKQLLYLKEGIVIGSTR